MKSNKLHTFLFALVIAALFLPMIQMVKPFVEVGPLFGSIVPTAKDSLTLEAWFDGTYQENRNKYINEQFGFRNTAVRLHNQIAFSLFRKAKANGVIIGKEDYLYEIKYINAFRGAEEINQSELDSNLFMLKAIQSKLKEKGVELIVVMNPGKASFYSEFIPDEFPIVSNRSYYSEYQKGLESQGIQHIDFGKWFREMKGKTPAPLFPKTGIHWSQYGATLAADSLVNYCMKLFGKSMNEFGWNKKDLPLSTSMESVDDDIGLGMNLYWPIEVLPMAYPRVSVKVKVDSANKGIQPKVAVISDSYFFNLMQLPWAPDIFSELNFYFYNKQLHKRPEGTMTNSDPLSQMKEIEKSNVVFVMATECNMDKLGWGFISSAYKYFVLGEKFDSFEFRVQKFKNNILSDEAWVKAIAEKAKQNKVPLDTMIMRDARYMAEMEYSGGN
ncbi:MAG: hypothetical protein ACEQSL_00390 [Sediminibacterium sp.]